MKKLQLTPGIERHLTMMRMVRRWGNLNVYTCERCGAHLVTTDLDEGTTPFLTPCREEHCGGLAKSGMYRVSPALKTFPTHGWYRPETIDGLSRETIEHLKQGGLVLRELTSEERSVFPEGGR